MSFRPIARYVAARALVNRRDADQVIGDDAEPDPALHSIETMVATAVESMTSFQHADAPFRADAPALPAPEPSLPFIGVAVVGDFEPRQRQDHPSHAALTRQLVRCRSS